MKTKVMYAVEYYCDLPDAENSNYNIYPTIKEAKQFASGVAVRYIFMADFNLERIFQEDNGHWNYDDHSDTYENSIILEDNMPDWDLLKNIKR